VPNNDQGSACDNDYYRSLAGTYTGAIDYTADSGTVCRWSMAMTIAPTDNGIEQCEIRTEVASTVEQSVVLPATVAGASQCIEANDTFELTDPLALVSNPVTGADFSLPMAFDFRNRASPAAPGRGPYFGDGEVSVRYINLFGTITPEAGAVVIGTDSVSIEHRDSLPTVRLSGMLVRQ